MNKFTEDIVIGEKYKRAKELSIHIKELLNNDKKQAFKLIEKELLGLIDINNNVKNNIIKNIIEEKKKKKLMFFYPQWFTGGVERTLNNIWNYLINYYEIYFVSNNKINSVIKIPDEIIHIEVSDMIIKTNLDYTLFTLSMVLNIDVVIGCASLFEKAFNFYKLASGTIKTIASNHGYYFDIYEDTLNYSIAEKRLNALEFVDAAVWLTNFSTYVYNNYNKNGCIIENANVYEIKNNVEHKKKEKIILCIGRFNDYVKRIDRILKCFSKVLTKIPDAKLILLGKFNIELPYKPFSYITIEDIVEELNINDNNIYYINEVSDMEKYYSIASVLLLASNSEGFGMVLTEAACFGVPSVCNYIPGLEDIIIDGENGFFTSQGDIDSMADRICEILNNESLRVRMGEMAMKLAKRYEINKIGEKWRLLIETILSDKPYEEKWYIINKNLGVEYNNIDLYAKNLCNEIRNLLNILIRYTDNNCIINRKYNFFIFHYFAIKEFYHKYGLKRTAKKLFLKIGRKFKLL